MKLPSSIPSNSVKLIDLYNKVVSENLITGPDYQRKLVWKKQHKYAFIETILLNFPFPEIYVASAELDLDTLKAREVVVDGQQRLSTIVDYINGTNDFKNQNRIKSFDELSEQEKRDFLNYLVPVKDLKDIGNDNIIEVFKRINSTNYSLNTNEILNAQYGGGEFATFCKMLADKNYQPTLIETSILLSADKRDFINTFFEKNKVFSDNDIKRMFDSQYIMLICATILEGQYFGRSSKINEYLEKYNDEFQIHEDILSKIYNSISLIDKLDFPEKSYWFNKANLFTLIIEIIKFKNHVNLGAFENNLNELENKVDIYFAGDESYLSLISPDETKYFEVARQGSHELSSRQHRGNVIRKMLENSMEREETTNSEMILKKLKAKNIKYAVILPTATGLSKSIMDATKGVREFLRKEGVHDYQTQDFGPDNKIKIQSFFIEDNLSETPTEVSLYRSNGRGDYRIWFSELKSFAEASDELILINNDGLKILNTKYDYLKYIEEL